MRQTKCLALSSSSPGRFSSRAPSEPDKCCKDILKDRNSTVTLTLILSKVSMWSRIPTSSICCKVMPSCDPQLAKQAALLLCPPPCPCPSAIPRRGLQSVAAQKPAELCRCSAKILSSLFLPDTHARKRAPTIQFTPNSGMPI